MGSENEKIFRLPFNPRRPVDGGDGHAGDQRNVVPFNKRRRENTSLEKAGDSVCLSDIATMLSLLITGLRMEHTDLANKGLLSLPTLGKFLDSLRDYTSNPHRKTNIHLRQQGIKERTIPELLELLGKSSAIEWKQHPAFYEALIRQLAELLDKLPKGNQ